MKLVCRDCEKEWERPDQRGRPPHRCPECAQKYAENISKEKAVRQAALATKKKRAVEEANILDTYNVEPAWVTALRDTIR